MQARAGRTREARGRAVCHVLPKRRRAHAAAAGRAGLVARRDLLQGGRPRRPGGRWPSVETGARHARGARAWSSWQLRRPSGFACGLRKAGRRARSAPSTARNSAWLARCCAPAPPAPACPWSCGCTAPSRRPWLRCGPPTQQAPPRRRGLQGGGAGVCVCRVAGLQGLGTGMRRARRALEGRRGGQRARASRPRGRRPPAHLA